MIDYIEKAKAFAMMAHKGQTDKAGKDYFTAHVAVVADGVEPDPLVNQKQEVASWQQGKSIRPEARGDRCGVHSQYRKMGEKVNHKLIDQNHKSGIL